MWIMIHIFVTDQSRQFCMKSYREVAWKNMIYNKGCYDVMRNENNQKELIIPSMALLTNILVTCK